MYIHNIEILEYAEKKAFAETLLKEAKKRRKSAKIKLAVASKKLEEYRTSIKNKFGYIPELKHTYTVARLSATIKEKSTDVFFSMREESLQNAFYNALNYDWINPIQSKVKEYQNIIDTQKYILEELYSSSIYCLQTGEFIINNSCIIDLERSIKRSNDMISLLKQNIYKYNIRTTNVTEDEIGSSINQAKFEFFNSTKAEWTAMFTVTKNKYEQMKSYASFVSPSGSMYFYHEKGVVRVSDHWGEYIASCYWTLKGHEKNLSFDGEVFIGAFCAWEDFDVTFIR